MTLWHHVPSFSLVSSAEFRFAPSQWESALLCNGVSHWLDASLESPLLRKWPVICWVPISTKIQIFSLKIHFKMSSAKCRPFSSSLNALKGILPPTRENSNETRNWNKYVTYFSLWISVDRRLLHQSWERHSDFGLCDYDMGHVTGYIEYVRRMEQSHKSHNAPVPYPTMHHSEQKCAHSVMNGALWVWDGCIVGFVNLVYYVWFKVFVFVVVDKGRFYPYPSGLFHVR